MSKIVFKEQASAPSTPASGYLDIYAKTDGKIYAKNDTGTEYDLTGSQAGMTSFTVAGDSGTPQTIEQANTLTIVGGEGLASVASTTDTLTVNLDINSLTADATPVGSTDYVLTWDASASAHKKVLIDNLPSGGGGMTSFNVAADSGTPEVVGDADTLTIAGGIGLSSTVAATDTVTVNLDINSLTADATPDKALDYVATWDASASTHKKVLLSALGSSFTASADGGTPQVIDDGDTFTIAGGSAITTTASATNTVTVDLNITELTEDTSPVGSTDFVVTYDASATANKKVLIDNIRSSFTIDGNAGGTSTIVNGDTLLFDGSGGIRTSVTGDTLSIYVDIDAVGSATPDLDADSLLFRDASNPTPANSKALIKDIIATPDDLYFVNEASNYTTTSATFASVDATNLSLDITTSGGDVMLGFYGAIANGTGNTFFDILIDNTTRWAGDDGIQRSPSSAVVFPVAFVVIITGLSTAAHNFKLQWKTNTGTSTLYAGAGTSGLDVHPQFWAKEIF